MHDRAGMATLHHGVPRYSGSFHSIVDILKTLLLFPLEHMWTSVFITST